MCFECDDVGHKRSSCPHKRSSCHPAQATGCAVNSGLQVAQQSTEEAETGAPHHDLITNKKTVQESGQVTERSSGNTEGQTVEESKGSGQKQGGVIDTQTTEAESQSVVAGGLNTVNVENEDEEMLEDDALSQFSDTVLNEHQQSYSIQEINHFLNKSYGRQ